ncbi:MAG: hypothetical protein U1F42_06570 [Candidatus Competibacteraceae bacterium]
MDDVRAQEPGRFDQAPPRCRWPPSTTARPRSAELPCASARQILTNLGQAEATAITAEDTADTTKMLPAPSPMAMVSCPPPPPLMMQPPRR